MAHAYETIATVANASMTPSSARPDKGPIGIAQIQCKVISCNGKRDLVAKPHYKRVIPASVAATIHELLVGVVQNGTGQSAAISGVDVAGKTGTTSDYGDAWFVGWTPQITTAVWVGFPNKLVPMTTLFDGGPVEGGTFPAEIWRAFMTQALQIFNQEKVEYGPKPKHHSTSTGTADRRRDAEPARRSATPAPPPRPRPRPSRPADRRRPATRSAPPAGTGTTPRRATPAPPAGGGTAPSAPAAHADSRTHPHAGATDAVAEPAERPAVAPAAAAAPDSAGGGGG